MIRTLIQAGYGAGKTQHLALAAREALRAEPARRRSLHSRREAPRQRHCATGSTASAARIYRLPRRAPTRCDCWRPTRRRCAPGGLERSRCVVGHRPAPVAPPRLGRSRSGRRLVVGVARRAAGSAGLDWQTVRPLERLGRHRRFALLAGAQHRACRSERAVARVSPVSRCVPAAGRRRVRRGLEPCRRPAAVDQTTHACAAVARRSRTVCAG